MKYSDPSGYINQNPLPRQETVDKEGFGSGSSWMDNFGDPGYSGWGGTFGGYGSNGGGTSLTPHLDKAVPVSNKQYAARNTPKVSAIIFSGTRSDPYQNVLGYHYSDGSSYYYSDDSSGQGDRFLDKGLDYAGKTNDAVSAFAKTLGTNGLTAVMVSGGKTIGRYSGPAGIVINAGQVFNGVRKDGYTYGYNAQKATAGAVGSIAGAWAGFQVGAWAGFQVGFTIGLAFEGVGAIPGAVIGGIVGGFGGAYGGNKFGESLIRNNAQ